MEFLNARGNIKHKNGKLIVGDFVDFCDGVIHSVHPRTSRFLRPNVANVEIINLIISSPPKTDFLLVDKVILSAIAGGARIILTVNKTDLGDDLLDLIQETYSGCVDGIFKVSAVQKTGLDELKAKIKGCLTVFMGQSAVGKTSILNALFSYQKPVGDLSDKTQRGRHTTTHSEIHFKNDFSIIDTPGFSEMMVDINSSKIKDFYIDFLNYSDLCFYQDCVHINEPNCAIKKALDEGKIPKKRYDRYVEIYNTIKLEEKNAKY